MPDVREKLVELQRSALEYLSDACSGHDCEECPYNEYGRNCDFVVRAEYLIANGVTIQRWIPVTERLPRKEEYTAKADDGTEYYVRLLIAYKTDIIEYEIGYYDGYKWMTEMPIRLIKDVVAWMPLHELPKGE